MNLQYPYPSQQYPQQPQMNPSYLPPAQYGGAQAGGSGNPGKESLQQQIKDLEKNLTGDYAQYWRYWLQLCLVLSILGLYPCASLGGTGNIKQIWYLIIGGMCLVSIVQCFFGIQGLDQKSLKIIRPVYYLMMVFWIPSLVFAGKMPSHETKEKEELNSLLVVNAVILALQSVNVFAISKVKKVLEEIERLQIRLSAIDGSSFAVQF